MTKKKEQKPKTKAKAKSKAKKKKQLDVIELLKAIAAILTGLAACIAAISSLIK